MFNNPEQEHTLNDFIEHLDSWWKHALKGTPNMGDTVICEDIHGGYQVTAWTQEKADEYKDALVRGIRILHRAAPPRPAWTDAVAVIAHTERNSERRVWVKDGGGDGYWGATEWLGTRYLIDPVPLIEQRVTDEMVARVENHFVAAQHASLPTGFAERILNIALGLDPA